MSDETEKSCVVCLSVQMAQQNSSFVAKGSVVDQCGTCGIDIYLAPTSKNFIDKSKTELICISCLGKMNFEEDEELKLAILPGSLEELKEALDEK
jgi:hypothetical protein